MTRKIKTPHGRGRSSDRRRAPRMRSMPQIVPVGPNGNITISGALVDRLADVVFEAHEKEVDILLCEGPNSLPDAHYEKSVKAIPYPKPEDA